MKLIKNLFITPFLAAIAAISLALIAQYGFGFKPCVLCLYQRIPLFIIIALLPIYFFKQIKPYQKTILSIVALAYFVAMGIAIFHSGVERSLWHFSECSAALDYSNPESLRNSLYLNTSVSCADVQLKILFLSMAEWNIIFSAFMTGFTLYLRRNHEES